MAYSKIPTRDHHIWPSTEFIKSAEKLSLMSDGQLISDLEGIFHSDLIAKSRYDTTTAINKWPLPRKSPENPAVSLEYHVHRFQEKDEQAQ